MKHIIEALVLLMLICFWVTKQNISKEDVKRFLFHELKVLLGFLFIGVIISFLLPIIFKGRISLNIFGIFMAILGLFYLTYLFIKYVLFAARAWHGVAGGKLTPEGNIVLSKGFKKTIFVTLVFFIIGLITLFIYCKVIVYILK